MNINVYLYNMNICKSNHALSHCRCACCTLLFIEINSTNILWYYLFNFNRYIIP